MDSTMRSDMFQSWIDRVLENKHKINQELHLGTMFEYTRLVDKKGNPIDPFVPKFDIMKATELTKDYRRAQKIDVESPRFIKTLERALVKLFTEADENSTKDLTYTEFYNAFKLLPTYDLCENDIRTLLALADDNANGMISWPEFIPIGIEAIKTFLARNKLLSKKSAEKVEISQETMKYIMLPEVKKITQIMLREFEDIDTDPETKEHRGRISFEEMRDCLKSTCHLVVKEVNLLLRSYVLKYGEKSEIVYTNFEEDLLNARYNLLQSRLMDINVMNLGQNFFQNSGFELKDGCRMHITDARNALAQSKELTLFNTQITNLIGHASMDENQTIDVVSFGKNLKELIERMYTVEPMRRKAQLI